MVRTGGYRRSAVWRPCGVTLHAAVRNKSVVCSGSRVTNSTIMKLHGSDNRGRITVKRTKSTCSHRIHKHNGNQSILNGSTNRSTMIMAAKKCLHCICMRTVYKCMSALFVFTHLVEMPLVEPHSKNGGVGSVGPGNYYSLNGTLLPD